MWLLYCKQRLSIDMKLLITSGYMRLLVVSALLLILWIAIVWSSLLP